MNANEFYEFIPFLILTELGYLIFAFLHWRFARYQLPGPARSLVYLLIATQFILIFMHAWTFDWADIQRQRQWDLNWERNIPTTFSTMQMAFVGVLAILLCVLGEIPRRRRVYIAVLGALFLLFAYDEYLLLHEQIQFIRQLYVGFGILFVPLSLVFAQQARRVSPPSSQLYLWAAFGIGIAGFGAFTLEALSFICLPQLGSLTDYCLRPYPLEEALENLGTLFILLAMLTEMKRSISPGRVPRVLEISVLLLVIYLGLLQSVHWFSDARESSGAYALRAAQQVSVDWDDGGDLLLQLRGWSIEGEEPAILQPRLSFFLSAGSHLQADFGYSFTLLDAVSLEMATAANQWQRAARSEWQPQRVIQEDFQPWELAELPANRAYLLTLAVWKEGNEGEFENIPIRKSDLRQLSTTQVVLGEFVVPAKEALPATGDEWDYRFGEKFKLLEVDVPVTARPGDVLAVSMTWQATQAGSEDWIQFLHFVHDESGALWNHDQEPLGARLPTRLWYAGLRDMETWQIVIPNDVSPGPYQVYTGLYRRSDLARLAVRDAEGTPIPEARLPLGTLTILNH